MRKFVATIFYLPNHGFKKVNIVFTDGEIVTLEKVYQKVIAKVESNQFTLISWSPVDEFL